METQQIINSGYLSAIATRRSIRKFKSDPLPDEIIKAIIQAGILAPSAKNRQPWHFVVTKGDGKAALTRAIQVGLQQTKNDPALPPEMVQYVTGAKHTLEIMKTAPVAILIFDDKSDLLSDNLSSAQWFIHCANIQSIGAAIQNMCLAATEMGVGSLWICDVFFAYQQVNEWAGVKGNLIAALSLGYADESPGSRPRKAFEDVVTWVE
jgi:nitroreductase